MPRKAAIGSQQAGEGTLRGRSCTVSLAVPGSVIENTQTMELATAVAGLLARTAAVFCIDELVVIDDAPGVRRATTVQLPGKCMRGTVRTARKSRRVRAATLLYISPGYFCWCRRGTKCQHCARRRQAE